MTMAKICKLGDIPKNGVKGFVINGRKIFIANINGKYYCNDSACTHKGGPLQDGELEGKTITCPWHGGTFDVTTGKNTGPPPQKPLNHYKVTVKGDEIWADLS